MASHPVSLPSLQEYLEQERRSDFRSEYLAGEIVAMSGGTGRHSALCVRMTTLLTSSTCWVFESNLKIYIQREDLCVYPDASVVCGTPEYLDSGEDVLLNPTLVVEVLSPSTKRYDRASKAVYYRGLPTLAHFLLISQDRILVEHSLRQQERTWTVETYTDLGSKIPLPLLGVELSIESIYRGIVER